jgi:hypothetical protein
MAARSPAYGPSAGHRFTTAGDRRKTGKPGMKKRAFAFALGAIAIANPVFSAAAAPVPCEDALKGLRAAEASAALSAADKTKVSDLEAKGVERCNADDDKRADDFFVEAMKIMGK